MFVVGRPRDPRDAPICSSDCGQTHIWKNNQKIAVTNIHVFMILAPMSHYPYRRLRRNFLSGFARRVRGPGGKRRKPSEANKYINIENSCFSVVRLSVRRRPLEQGRHQY
jgi:hypothetical protein